MTRLVTTAALALALIAGTALAKGHDQGVADGDFDPGTQTGAKIGKGGIGGAVNKGKRGDAASDAGGDNAQTPVVGNGKNAAE